MHTSLRPTRTRAALAFTVASMLAVVAVPPQARAGAVAADAWGLDRIDQHALPLDDDYSYTTTGAGVTVYILSGGVQSDHAEFTGRLRFLADCAVWTQASQQCSPNAPDESAISDPCTTREHGTHAASVVGGTTYGVAKDVELVDVRVIGNCSSYNTYRLVAGIGWVNDDHTAGDPAVVLITNAFAASAQASAAIDTAVRDSIANEGITYVVPTSDGTTNSPCSETTTAGATPARVTEAMTVGLTDKLDTRKSSYGACLDFFGPGVTVRAANWSRTSTTSSQTWSGSFVAAAHAAGAAARYLQSDPTATPATVEGHLVAGATADVVVNPGPGSPNLLLYMSSAA